MNIEPIIMLQSTGEEAGDLSSLGQAHMQKAKDYIHSSELDNAIKMFDLAQTCFEKTANWQRLGTIYQLKGMILMRMKDYANALETLNQALVYFEKTGDVSNQCDVYTGIAGIYSLNGKMDKAVEFWHKGLQLSEKEDNVDNQIMIHSAMAETFFYSGIYKKAIEHYHQLLFLYEKKEDCQGLGETYRNLGNIYSQTHGLAKAMEMYNHALPFFEKTGDMEAQAFLYRLKGNAYNTQGDYSMAREEYQKTLVLYEKIHNTIEQGVMAKDIGNTYYNTGAYFEALKMYHKALTLFEEKEYLLGMFEVYLKKNAIFTHVANFSRGKDMHEKANHFLAELEKSDQWQKNPLRLMRNNPDQYLDHLTRSGNMEGLGNEYLNRGLQNWGLFDHTASPDYEKTLAMFTKAQECFEKIQNLEGLCQVYMFKGNIYGETKQVENALQHYHNALTLANQTGSIIYQISLAQDMAYLYDEIGDHANALQEYEVALSLQHTIGDIQAEADTLLNIGLLLKKMGRIPEALECIEKYIAKLEKFRQQIAFSELKKTFYQRFYLRYEFLILFILDNNYQEQAFQYVEFLKARLFLDQLSEAQVELEKDIKPELQKDKINATAKLSSLTREITETRGKRDSKKLTELTEQYRQAENQLEDLLIKIRLDSPAYTSVQYPEPITLHQLQKSILKEGELVVRYFFAQDNLYVFLISQEDFKVLTLHVPHTQVEADISLYLMDMCSPAKDYPAIFKKAEHLYQKIFKPIESEMAGITDLIIIPDGHLTLIPFESLVIEHNVENKPVFLIEKYRVKYMQSASVLAFLRKQEKQENISLSFIGFGDPVYDYENFKQGTPEKGVPFHTRNDTPSTSINLNDEGIHCRSMVMDRLHESGEEVKAIADIFKKQTQNYTVYLREHATEKNAKAPHLKDFQYIHFACHGILGDHFQSLVLSQIPDSQEDGYLTLNDIMNSQYHAKLVVLSACETAKGKMERAEGLTGLTRAVMYAGTPAVMASLWTVDDKGTKELMVKFYENLLEKGMGNHEALRQAKLALIHSNEYAAPFFWSAFVLYGE